jgi:hypothetical protein
VKKFATVMLVLLLLGPVSTSYAVERERLAAKELYEMLNTKQKVFTQLKGRDAKVDKLVRKIEARSRPKITSINIDAIRVGRSLILELDGEQHEVDFISSDTVADTNHIWRGEIKNRGTVEFSLSHGEVYGEFIIDGQQYLVLPAGDLQNHIMVRAPDEKKNNQNLLKTLERKSESAHKRHKVIDQLKSTPPGKVKLSKRGNVRSYSDRSRPLGVIDNGQAQFNDFAKDIMMLSGSETFEVDATIGKRGTKLTLRQRINGILVDEYFSADVSDEGVIETLIGSAYPDSRLPVFDEYSDLPEFEAKELALDAVRQEIQQGSLSWDAVRLMGSKMVYRRIEGEDEVSLFWRIAIRLGRKLYTVYGDVKTSRTIVFGPRNAST